MQAMNIPARKDISRLVIEKFKGADFSTYSGDVDPSRSPDMLNMISDRNGQPVKRMGYEKVKEYDARINGLYTLAKGAERYDLVHTGTKLYLRGEEDKLLSVNMNDARSIAFQAAGKLWILDGASYLYYDGETFGTAASIAYVPTTRVQRKPGTTDPGGKSYEPVNLLQPYRINTFYVSETDADAKIFMLDFTPDSAATVTAEVRNGDTWAPKTNFTVSGAVVTFSAATGAKGPEGEDNVRIKAARTVSGYADRIKKCTVQTMFGVGAHNQAFLSGNPDYLNYQWHSAEDDPAYFPDTGYEVIGQDNTAIMGYRKSGQYLVVLKENNYQDATAFLIMGSQYTDDDGDLVKQYTAQQGIAGVGAISKYCFCDLRDDHIFLSEEGVFAITTNAVTAEKYAQTRSALVNRKLAGQNLADAVGTVHEGYFYLAVDGVCYVADAAQKHYDGKGAEQYQYEWYYWDDMPVRVWGQTGGRLEFGTPDGEVMRMHEEKVSDSYSDDGRAILARWTTPVLDFSYGDLYKTLKYLFVRYQPFTRSSAKVYVRSDGAWVLVDERTLDIFGFFDVDFNRFSFNTDPNVLTASMKVNEKKIITTQIKVENDAIKEGFGLQNMIAQYFTKSRIK